MKEIDRLTIESFGIPGRVLMENAGRGAVEVLLERFPAIGSMRVGIAAGRGNNGGDGFVIARYLSNRDVDVRVYLLASRDRIQGDALANLVLLDQMGVPVREICDTRRFEEGLDEMEQSSLWVDAMLGTGLESDVRGLYVDVIDFINRQNRPVLAVDIPSGLNADTGKPCGSCIRATVTATFGLPKIGQVVMPGAEFAGELEIVDIGIPPSIVRQAKPTHRLLSVAELKTGFMSRLPDAHKGTAGHLLVLGASPGKTGAIAMTAQAAMRVGAGLVTAAIPGSLNATLEARLMEVMTHPLPEEEPGCLGPSAYEEVLGLTYRKSAIAVGPGLGTAQVSQEFVRKLVENSPLPLIIDADALNCLAGQTDCLKKARVPIVMTPHPGEMARLVDTTTEAVQENRISTARSFALGHAVHLVLKGARTVIAAPDGTVSINPTGNPGMASGGMGDVLTGIISGLIAQGLSISDAVEAGVYLHGAAGDALARDMGPVGFIASDLIAALPRQLKRAETLSSRHHSAACRGFLTGLEDASL